MTALKWKRGPDWPSSGDEYLFADAPEGRYTIKRSIRGRVDPWYELFLEGRYVSADWVLRKLKPRASKEYEWTP